MSWFARVGSTPFTFIAGVAAGAATMELRRRIEVQRQTTQRHSDYLDLLEKYPKLDARKSIQDGAMEVIRDRTILAEMEKKGHRVGICWENKWVRVLNDAVRFPNGQLGTYVRIVWNSWLTGGPGAVVMPKTNDGRYLCNIAFRHATQEFELEFPRGNQSGQELAEAVARRELREETGAHVKKLTKLGEVNADSGLSPGGTHIFEAEISSIGPTERDPAESGMSQMRLTRQELEEAFRKGSIEVPINGKLTPVSVKDGFTMAALFHSSLKNVG